VSRTAHPPGSRIVPPELMGRGEELERVMAVVQHPAMAQLLRPRPEPLEDRLDERRHVFRAMAEVVASIGPAVVVLEDLQAPAVYDGDLIAAGAFTEAGGVPVNRIARWDGTDWSPLGSGIDGGTVLDRPPR
jgi:hypothetical protein